MARTKKITNPMEDIMKKVSQTTKTIEWNGIQIEVKNRLSLREVSSFVDSASSICFTNSDEYVPEVFDYAISVVTIGLYTNFSLPESVEEQYDVIMFTDIMDKITECIEAVDQYASIVDSVKERIDYKINSNISIIRNQAQELFSSVENLLSKLSETFGALNNEDIQNLVSNLAAKDFDEEKLMKAYLENKK